MEIHWHTVPDPDGPEPWMIGVDVTSLEPSTVSVRVWDLDRTTVLGTQTRRVDPGRSTHFQIQVHATGRGAFDVQIMSYPAPGLPRSGGLSL